MRRGDLLTCIAPVFKNGQPCRPKPNTVAALYPTNSRIKYGWMAVNSTQVRSTFAVNESGYRPYAVYHPHEKHRRILTFFE